MDAYCRRCFFFQFLITIRLAIWVVTGLAIEYGALQVSQTFVNAGFSLFLFFFGMFWEGRLLGQVIASAVWTCCAIINNKVWLNSKTK